MEFTVTITHWKSLLQKKKLIEGFYVIQKALI